MDDLEKNVSLSILKDRIKSFQKDLEDFSINIGANLSTGFQKIANFSVIINNLSSSCEACHNILASLYSAKKVDSNDPIVIELWDLTKAFEYIRRKYEKWLLAKHREIGPK